MLPALHAEAQLDRIQALGAAGRMTKLDRQAYLRDLRQPIEALEPAKVATPQSLAAMGIEVVEEPVEE